MRVSPRESAVNEPNTKSKSILASRRKLVRGVFAVPAVVTLTSGSPAAATSLSCFQRQFQPEKGGPVIPADGVGAGYDFLRVNYFKRTDTARFFIKGSDLHNLALVTGGSVSSSLAASNQFHRVNDAKDGLDDVKRTGITLESQPSGALVIRFDEHGNIVGVGKGTTGSAIYGSCWVSAYPSH
jgi:hypothetical protein